MKLFHLLATLACAALAAFTRPANAAPGDLDLTFGGTGKVTTDFGGYGGRAVALQSDGKLVVAGSAGFGVNSLDFALVRYNIDGSLDTTFNGSGMVTTGIGFFVGGDARNDFGESVTVQADGKIVVAGYADTSTPVLAVARYNANGTLDTTFNGTGKATTDFGGTNGGFGKSVAVQSDQKIVVAGYSSNGSRQVFALVRYNADGTLDSNFNGEGKVTTAIGSVSDVAQSVTLQSDLKIVVTGWSHNGVNYDIALVRYNADGSLDATFNGTGKVTTPIGSADQGYSVKVMGDGKIVVACGAVTGSSYDFAVVRYNANGSLDTTFNGEGKMTTAIGTGTDSGYSVIIQSDGKIVVAGNLYNGESSNFALVRYNTDGSLDTSFGGTGNVTTDFGSGLAFGYSTVIQRNGKIVVAGSYGTYPNARFALARYEGEPDTDEDGILDTYETGTGTYVSPTNTGTSPTNPDSDGDGLRDGDELDTYNTNPNIKDTDGDGFDDGFEVTTGFSPTSAASTPDALSSIRTVAEYRFNAALGINYRIEASTDLANWTTIETNIIGAGGVITRFYSIEGQPRRFFRSRRN